jgi:hypothetical protein
MPKPKPTEMPVLRYAVLINGMGVEKSDEAEFEKDPRAYRDALWRELWEEHEPHLDISPEPLLGQ